MYRSRLPRQWCLTRACEPWSFWGSVCFDESMMLRLQPQTSCARPQERASTQSYWVSKGRHRNRRIQVACGAAAEGNPAGLQRRRVLELAFGAFVSKQLLDCPAVSAAAFETMSDTDGFGTHPAAAGDLVLVHYVGTIAGTDTVFDSTRGGLRYRDGGLGVLRPAAIRLGGGPVPGICSGLQQAILGMRVGGRRTVVVPPELGFGPATVLAPYAVLPGGSTLQYEVELLRLSSIGPDALFKGVSKCSAGGASAAVDNCAIIEPAEFI